MKKQVAMTLLGVSMAGSATAQSSNQQLLDVLRTRGIITATEHAQLSAGTATADAKPEPKPQQKASDPRAPRLSGKIRFDYRYYYNGAGTIDSGIAQDTFDLDKASLSLKGKVTPAAGYKLGADFSKGAAKLKDAYIKFEGAGDSEIHLGQFKHGFGHERQHGSTESPFLERTPLTKLGSSRDRGIAINGTVLDGEDPGPIFYQIGIYNGSGSNSRNNNDDLDVIAKTVIAPSFDTVRPWIGASYWSGKQTGTDEDDEIELQTESVSGNTFFVADIPENRRYGLRRIAVGGGAVIGPFMANAEYLRSQYSFDNSVAIKGGYITLSHMLTGERRQIEGDEVVYPRLDRPFDPQNGHWGRWEIGLRYSWFEVDDRFFIADGLFPGWSALAPTDYSDRGEAWTLGLSWFLSDALRLGMNWVHSVVKNDLPGGTSDIFSVDDGSSTNVEDALIMRLLLRY